MIKKQKDMKSKIIFKDQINHVSTDVGLSNNYDMVCRIIFSQDFTIQTASLSTI